MNGILDLLSMWNYQSADPRIRDRPLMDTIYPTIAICVFYLVMDHRLKAWMKNRKPFNIKGILFMYNFYHFVASIVFLAVLYKVGWFEAISWW